MKKIFSLLGLLICVMSAWGTLTPVSISYSSTSTTDGWSTGTGGRFVPAILNNDADGYFLSVDQGSRNNNGATVTGNVISGKAEAGDDFTVTFDLRISSSNNQTSTEFKILDATNGANIFSLKETGTWATTWIINGDGTKTVTLPNSNKAGSGNTITDVPWYSVKVCRKGTSTYLTISDKASGDAILTKEAIATQSENGGLGKIQFVSSRYYANFAINNIVVRAIQDGDAPAGPAYSIRYMLGSTVVKTESGEAPVGEKLTSKAVFTENNVKYFATNGVQEFTNTENPANNIFDVPVREAYNFKYTVHAVAGTVDEVIGSGTVLEGESASVLYSQYINVNGTLYKAAKQSTNPWWGINVTPTSDNFVQNISYAQAATNIAFYSEAEDIAGITVITGGNANIRCSKGAGGFFEGETGGTVTTLQPGVYKLYTSVWGNAGMKFTFNAGEKTILEAESKGYIQDYTSEEFVISKPTDITMIGGAAGNAPKIIDYVYIQKTADYVATESITIADATPEIGKAATLAATIAPANASSKTITWSLDEASKEYAELNAATGELTPLKAGDITIKATNGEKEVEKVITIAPAEFAVTITGAPSEAQVFVGEDASAEDVLQVTTKEGYDQMQNTTRLQPQGSVKATEIATYIYTITVNKDKKTVDVVYEKDIEVTAMEFAVKDQRIAQGNSRTLQVTYYPADASFKTATWTSSNPEVATVDAKTGLVTAVSEGETTITATWSENESHGTDYSAEMTLTVDKGLVIDRIVFDELDDATAEVMGYYHPMDGDTLYLASHIESNGRMVPVSFIRYEAFIGSNLKSIVIPGTVKTIDHRALQYSNTHNAYEELPEDGLESAFLMEGVEVMRDRIFHGNKYMKKVFLPSTLTDIGYYSFYGTAIEDVFFGGSEDEWNALKNLENAKLPETAKIHFNSDFTSAFIDGIEVDEENVELEVGEQKTIGFIITPESIAPSVEVTFTSSNENVATVDETGVITAVANGYATITVSAGAGIEAKVRVKVGNEARDYTTPLTTTWSVQGGANPEGIFVDEETHYYNNWGAGASWFAQAYAEFDLSNLQPDDDFRATFTVWVNCARGTRTFDVYGLPAGTTVADCQALTAKKGVELATYSDIVTDYQAKEVDVTDYIKGLVAEGSQNAIIIMSNGAAGGNIYGKGSAEFAPTLNIYPANGETGPLTGISEAQSNESTVKSGKYMENGQIVIYIDGKKFNAAGQQIK